MPQIHTLTSDLLTSYLETEQGPLPVQGFHALAGIELTQFPLRQEPSLEREHIERWARRMAWFWNALAFGLTIKAPAWFISFELRVGGIRAQGARAKDAALENPLRAGLWAKTVSPDPTQAEEAAVEMAEMALALLPPEYQPKPIATRKQFLSLWGEGAPPWLGEIRPGMSAAPKENGNRMDAAGWNIRFSAWNLHAETMLEPWAILAQLQGAAWVSLSICPTRLFEPEKKAAQDLAEMDGGLFSLPTHAPLFQVRVRVGGEEKPAQWLAQALAGVLCQPDQLPPVLAIPATAEERLIAEFNWQWADCQPWAELPLPVPLRRFRYLHDADVPGILAGMW